MSEISNEKIKSKEWNYEAEQNWFGFWDLIVKEYIKQNPEEYKKLKEEIKNENNRSSNSSHKT